MSAYRDSLDTADAGGALASTWRNDALTPRLIYDKFAQTLQPSAAPGMSSDHPQFLGDAIGDTIGTASDLAINTTITSLIDSVGDHDVFRINLVAGQTYTFSMERTDWGSGIDSYLDLLDGSGVTLKSDDDGGIYNNSQITFTATSSGTYYLVAHSFSDSSTGAYALTTNTLEVGNTSPDNFTENGKPMYSWEQAAFQINRDFQTVDSSNWPGDQASWAPRYETPAIVTYAFRANAPATMPEDTAGFSQFNAAQIAAAQAALAAWASVANIVFVRVDDGGGYSDNASILFGNYSSGASAAAAFAFLPVSGATVPTDVQGDVWVNSTLSYNSNPVVGDYGAQVLLHEIGHAIGLSHPGDYNAAPGVSITYANSAEYFQDTRMFTVMSYFGSTDTGGNLALYASLPQLHDIAAIQHLYGANTSTRAGDTVYGFNSNTGLTQYSLTSSSQASVFSIWDSGGNDTLDLSGYNTGSTIDLREEAFSSAGPGSGSNAHSNISIARGAVIENAIGGGASDVIIGNAANNTLSGGGGGDTMWGNLGNDTILGGDGSDTINYAVGDGADAIDGGNDSDTLTIFAPLAASDDTLVVSWVSGIRLSGVGGGTIANVESITADLGDGVDTLVYSATNGATVNLGLHSASGFSTIFNIENVTGGGGNDSLTGDALANLLDGGGGADALSGGDGVDTLYGRAGADTLDGGIGADVMFGGDGDDIYVVDNAGDATTDNGPTGGTDTVQASISWTLTAAIDNLTLIGGAANGTGNELANAITGNALANILNGKAGDDVVHAGDGADTLYGGDGADQLYGENDADLLDGGNNNDALYGGAAVDTLYGRAGADSLDGGAGADTMYGGDGDDTYYVDDAGDITGEPGGAGGVDTVISSVTRSLGQYLENLTLSGGAVINGAGNILNNTLTGNDADNTLSGFAGADTLYGNGGADTLNGGDGNDTLNGGDGGDILDGGANDDTLNGGAGDDTLYGRTQNDTLNGDAGADILWGGDGDDVLNGGDDNDQLDGGNHNDTLSGGNGDDTLYGRQNDDTLSGDAGNDTLYGGDGVDSLNGGDDNDHLEGGNGADTLLGGAGDDVLLGQADNDVLNGQAGSDTYTGGAGDDTFTFSQGAGADHDLITDFVAGGTDDTLDFSSLNGAGITWSISQDGLDTLFSFSNGDDLRLANVDMNNLVVIDPWHYG